MCISLGTTSGSVPYTQNKSSLTNVLHDGQRGANTYNPGNAGDCEDRFEIGHVKHVKVTRTAGLLRV